MKLMLPNGKVFNKGLVRRTLKIYSRYKFHEDPLRNKELQIRNAKEALKNMIDKSVVINEE